METVTICPVRTISREGRSSSGTLRDCTPGPAPPELVKIQSEPCGDTGRLAEMTGPSKSHSEVTMLPKVAKFLVG